MHTTHPGTPSSQPSHSPVHPDSDLSVQRQHPTMHLHRDSTDSEVSAGSFDFHGIEHEIDYFDEPDDESTSNLSAKLGREISKDAVAVLISKYGNSSATAWLEYVLILFAHDCPD